MKLAGIILIVISTLTMFIFLFAKSDSFISLREIIDSHLKLFKNSKKQYLLFYLLPLIFAVGLALVYEAGATFYENLSIIVSILLSMLLAILSILSSIKFNFSDKATQEKIKNLLTETNNAIIFDTLLSIGLLLFGLVMIVIGDISACDGIVKRICAGVSYYLFVLILINILLIIKRIGRIIKINTEN